MNKHLLSIVLLASAAVSSIVADSPCTAQKGCAKIENCNNDCVVSHNTWLPRSFSSYSTRNMIQEKQMYQTESQRDEWFGTFSMATEYMQNFGQKCNSCKNLGAMPFWSGTNTMTVGNNLTDGSNVDAHQFGLGNLTIGNDENGNPKFGTITLDPRVQHVGTDFLLHFTHKKDERGLFFKLNAPLGAMIINPRLTEEGITPDGLETFTQTLPLTFLGFETPTTITYEQSFYPPVARRPKSMSEAFMGGTGCCGHHLDGSVNKEAALQYGKIASGRQAVIKFADLSASIGYNVWGKEDKGFLGLAFKGTCPTGNVPTGEYMLEPIFGRAGAWGVGAELMGHYKVWENDAQTKYLDVWLQGEVLHLMPGRKPNYRSFDLKDNGLGSKYLLIQYYEAGISAEGEEIRNPKGLDRVINHTTLPVISKIKAEGSVALGFDFHCNNWNAAIIAEFWGRTKETLSIDMCTATQLRLQNLNDYAVLGRQASAYVDINGPADVTLDEVVYPITSITSSVSSGLAEPKAMICKSENTALLTGEYPNTSTLTLSAPTLAADSKIKDATKSENRIPAKLEDALDIEGAAAVKAFTGKVTGQLGYTFADYRYTPTVSIFGGAELTPRCSNNAMQYWSVGLQAALNF